MKQQRYSFVSCPIEPKNTTKIHEFSLLSILIIHRCSVCYLTIDVSLRPTHISFDLDVLFVASRGPRNRSKTTREISERMFAFKHETTLTEYSLISWPIKLHSYPAPCQRPRIQRKVEVRCREGRPLPFYQAKGQKSGHLSSTSSICENSKRSRYAISIQNTLVAWRSFLFVLSDGHSLHLSL